MFTYCFEVVGNTYCFVVVYPSYSSCHAAGLWTDVIVILYFMNRRITFSNITCVCLYIIYILQLLTDLSVSYILWPEASYFDSIMLSLLHWCKKTLSNKKITTVYFIAYLAYFYSKGLHCCNGTRKVLNNLCI